MPKTGSHRRFTIDRRRLGAKRLAIWLLALAVSNIGSARAASITTQLMEVSTDSSNFGYGAGDINSCAIDHNNLITVGNYQYIAYYGPTTSNRNSIFISRRTLGTTTWSAPVNSMISISAVSPNNEIIDDHNVIALGVDSNGYMHISWDMHNTAL